MRILIIRHGDPDYKHDALTEKGRREATLLGKADWDMCTGANCHSNHLGAYC